MSNTSPTGRRLDTLHLLKNGMAQLATLRKNQPAVAEGHTLEPAGQMRGTMRLPGNVENLPRELTDRLRAMDFSQSEYRIMESDSGVARTPYGTPPSQDK